MTITKIWSILRTGGYSLKNYMYLTMLLWMLFISSAVQADTPAQRPNIIVILVDDLGWFEPECYGNTYNETPNVNALAASGMRFTNAYAAAPVCSPYRASLMTGQSPVRLGIYKWIAKNDYGKKLARQYTTVAELLKPAGYSTGIVGKWHLSRYADDGETDPIPATQQGFDEDLAGATTSIGSGDYWYPYWIMPRLEKADAVLDSDLPDKEYLVDRCNYEAINFIDRHQDEPFFLYLSHYAVHTTLDGKPTLVEHFESKPDSGKGIWAPRNNPHLASQLYTIDEGLGMIMAKLEELGIKDNTMIIFTSDNGGSGDVTDNGPLRGAKRSLYEGGIRIPLIISMPGVVKAGTVCDEPVVSYDFFPTFAEMLGLDMPAGQYIDGLSMVDLFSDPQASLPRDRMCWYFPLDGQSAIRKGDWKLVEDLNTGTIELFNITKDLSEEHDLKYDQQAKAAELLSSLKDWRSSMPRFADTNTSGSVGHDELNNLTQNWLDDSGV